jgi:hypothetical protein
MYITQNPQKCTISISKNPKLFWGGSTAPPQTPPHAPPLSAVFHPDLFPGGITPGIKKLPTDIPGYYM